MDAYKYINRYDNIYKFIPIDENTILMEGDFTWTRIGWPNDYSLAYEKYLEDGGTLSIKGFKDVVHEYDDDKGEFLYLSYIPLITSITNKIDMIDPSGGPYIRVGMPSNLFHPKIKDKVISEIVADKRGYKLILK